MPISFKRISSKDCNILTDKMSAMIHTWSSRHLSYQGRLQLVNSVLMSIHVYWAQVFVLPRKILKEVEKMCRAYLWSGDAYSAKPGNVAWSQVCVPKREGGLGLRKIQDWNVVAMGRYV